MKLTQAHLPPEDYAVQQFQWSFVQTKIMRSFLKYYVASFRSWSCNAAAELRILNFKPETEPFTRSKSHNYRYLPQEKLCKVAASACQKSFFKYLVFHTIFFPEIQHLFYSKENDWGFSTFIPWNVSYKYF